MAEEKVTQRRRGAEEGSDGGKLRGYHGLAGVGLLSGFSRKPLSRLDTDIDPVYIS
jgi:hypothetical protein